MNGTDASMMLEFNHFLVNNIDRGRMRLFGRFDGIVVGEVVEGRKSNSPFVTVGLEQEYNLTDKFWVAAVTIIPCWRENLFSASSGKSRVFFLTTSFPLNIVPAFILIRRALKTTMSTPIPTSFTNCQIFRPRSSTIMRNYGK